LTTPTIEDIILQKDQRGISALRPFLPVDYATQAAQFVLDHDGLTIIVTGFYILYGKAVETDGPPGAVGIGKALESLGRRVVYVTDHYSSPIMRELTGPKGEVVDFPIADKDNSLKFAENLLKQFDPSLLISIERCSPSEDGIYRNMRSVDISDYNAKVDTLFTQHSATVGIGDGGNEIGMGKLLKEIPNFPKMPAEPASVACNQLIIASVSNWGGYGLIAALSKLTGKNLLPSVDEEADWVKRCVRLGAVDGFNGEVREYVDGFPLEEYGQALHQLHQLVSPPQ
jgi:hypothetical protein